MTRMLRSTRITTTLFLLGAACVAALLAPGLAAAARRAPTPGIFPSNRLTVRDHAQLTGRRIDIRPTNCRRRPSDCEDVRLLDQLDGFDLDPRVTIRFGRSIDLRRVTGRTLYLTRGRGRTRERFGLNRIVWDRGRHTLYGQPTRFLSERTTYRIVVSRSISGRGASTTFTTMSATSALDRMRRQLDDGSAYAAAGIPAAGRGLSFTAADGTRTVFPASNVLQFRRFNDVGRAGVQEASAPEAPNLATMNVQSYAFGSFQSPSWLTRDRVIPQVPTRRASRARGRETVGFALILPSGAKPAGGWPVAIFGPGITRSKYDVFLAADNNAKRGIATIAIDPAGHSFGPRSETGVDLVLPPRTVRFSAFGRGRDLNHDGVITNQEGVSAPVQPNRLADIGLRDGLRQTALDNMALVRAIGRGVDVDGDGSVDLSRANITYYAQSLGGIYGTMLMGTDPRVRVGVLNVAGGPILDIARLSPSFRPLVAAELRNRRPSLLNGGRDGFTESEPLFLDPPVSAPARGAVAIQDVGSRVNWINRSGSPETFAPLLRRRPLRDVGAKRVIYQFAFGDQTVPNPTSATIMRAGGLQALTTYYRNDRTPTAGSNPHGFLLDPRLTGRNLGQAQVLEFLASGGTSIVDPDGAANVFEVPIADPRTLEQVNFTP